MISHLFREAAWYVRNEFTTTLTSFVGLFLSQLVLGLYLLVLINVWMVEENLRSEMTIEVYLKPDLTQPEMGQIDQRIRSLPGVREATFRSKQEALLSLKEQLGEEVIRGLGENPLPPGYSLGVQKSLRSREGFEAVSRQLKSIPGIDEVIYGQSLLERLDKVKRLILYTGALFGCLTFLAVVMVVFSASRLLVASRSAVVEVMKLLGASRFYLRSPYLFLGFFSGLLASGLSLLSLYLVAEHLLPQYIAMSFLPTYLLWSYLFWGALLGLVGAFLASGKYITRQVLF